MDKPISPKVLEDQNSKIVKTLLKIYTMESFLVYNLNKIAREKDESLLPYYGPYAAALSYILATSKTKTEMTLYRGL